MTDLTTGIDHRREGAMDRARDDITDACGLLMRAWGIAHRLSSKSGNLLSSSMIDAAKALKELEGEE